MPLHVYFFDIYVFKSALFGMHEAIAKWQTANYNENS